MMRSAWRAGRSSPLVPMRMLQTCRLRILSRQSCGDILHTAFAAPTF
jgi:hypothetical protein